MTEFKRTVRIATLPLAAILYFPFSACAAESDGWDWMVAPYGWAVGISADLETSSPPSSSSTDIQFSDIVDKLDGAAQIHVEGQGDRFGVFADYTHLGRANDNVQPRFHTESDLDTRLFEIAAVWKPGDKRRARGALLHSRVWGAPTGTMGGKMRSYSELQA